MSLKTRFQWTEKLISTPKGVKTERKWFPLVKHQFPAAEIKCSNLKI